MKRLRITFTKPGASAQCLLSYRETGFHDSAEWSGSQDAFEADGRLPLVGGSLDILERLLSHQAASQGFQFQIQDLGGEASRWTDAVDI